jgi:hypothetical protein
VILHFGAELTTRFSNRLFFMVTPEEVKAKTPERFLEQD